MLSSQGVKNAITHIFTNCFMNVYNEGWPTCDLHTSFCFFMTDVTVAVKAVIFVKCQSRKYQRVAVLSTVDNYMTLTDRFVM